MIYQVDTRYADEYQQAQFMVDNAGKVVATVGIITREYIGMPWLEADLHMFSIFKFWSTKDRDNIYPHTAPVDLRKKWICKRGDRFRTKRVNRQS